MYVFGGGSYRELAKRSCLEGKLQQSAVTICQKGGGANCWKKAFRRMRLLESSMRGVGNEICGELTKGRMASHGSGRKLHRWAAFRLKSKRKRGFSSRGSSNQ